MSDLEQIAGVSTAELRRYAKLAEFEDLHESQAIAELDTAENR